MPLVIRTPYGAGVRALEHTAESTEALFCQIPGLTVVVLRPPTTKGLLIASLRSEDPVIFLEPSASIAPKSRMSRRAFRSSAASSPNCPGRQGPDAHRLGGHVPVMEKAAEEAAGRGVSAEILDLRTLAPMTAKPS